MLQLFGHPLSSYSWKVLIALYEKGSPFEWRILSPDYPDHGAEWAARWPLLRFPLLIDGGRQFAEASVIVEYLDLVLSGSPRLVPQGAAGLEVRFLDRVFDNYVMSPMQKFVADRLRPADARDPFGVAEAATLLDTAYAWLDGTALRHRWAAGEAFTLADCAAAPALYYADKVHPFAGRFPTLAAYLARLEARPSFARVIAEAQPYWHMFPFA